MLAGGRLFGWQSRRDAAAHVTGVVITALAGLLAAVLAHLVDAAYGGPGLWAGTALQLAATPVLLLSRRTPLTVTLVMAAAALALVAPWPIARGPLFLYYNSIDPWVPVMLTSVGALVLPEVDRRRAPVAWASLGLVAVVAMRPWDPSLPVVTSGLLHTAAPTLLGLYVAARRRLIRMLRERAERAEREQGLVAAQARADERARLAAEMHDVISHRVSLMVLQAGALGITAPDEATRRAAEELRAAGGQALEELRDVVGVLRRGPVARAPAPRAPAGLPNIADLIAESDAGGVPVVLVSEGSSSLASPVVSRTAYRVVQEALTNVRKHAPGAAVHVRLCYAPDRVHVTVTNGSPTNRLDPLLATSGSGTGLLGLEQRVEVIGGTLEAASRPDGGFEVSAMLPACVPDRIPDRGRDGR